MAQSDEELVAASETATEGSENRLTEVLATVLDAHHPLSAELFACRGLDAGVRVRYFTQEWLAPRCQPDMVARSEDQQGAPLAELWFENKKDSGFRPGQLEDYRDALALRAGSNGLMALEPEAPAMWRLLHELVAYLEKEDLAVLKPLDQRHVDAFRDAPDTWERLEALVSRASRQTGLSLRGEVEAYDDGSAVWQLFEPSPSSWHMDRIDPEEHECWAELSLWAEEPLDEPSVAAGYTLPLSLYQTLHAHRDLAARANSVGLEIREWDDQARIVRIEKLAQLVEGSDSLADQADRVAVFAAEAISAAEGLDPEELQTPPTRRTGPRS